MKKLNLLQISIVAILLAGAVIFAACKKDKDKDKADTPTEAGIKKAQELCDCFKKSSENDAKACVQSLNAKSEYLKFEENAEFNNAFQTERTKCSVDTPDWW